NISIAAGTLETLVIKLSNPFLSDGRNIVVMTERPMDSQSFGMNSFFYETRSDIVNRSRFYASDKDSFDDTQEGEPTNRHPNMSLYMIIDGGTLSGTVTDGTDPIPGVTIEVLNENLHAITNENGVFEFVFMPVGNFELKAGKLGYEDIVKNATISLDNNTVVDFELSLRPVYNISGTITRDKTTIPLEGAVVTLKGDSNYEATSGTDGKYEIQNVYSGYTYDVEISKYGYTSQIATLSVNENVTDYDFSLDELLYPVNLVEGKVNASGEMEITWYNPTSSFPKDFRYDNGIAVGKMSISNGNSNSILGAVHKAKSQINEISWMTNDTDFNPPAKVNVFILDLDENGMPTQTLLYSAVDLDNENQQWMTHILPNSIEAPNGFMLGISCNDGNICLGVSKPDDDYPFNKNVQFLSADYTTGDFTVVETLPGAGNYNLMIRAKGYQMGEQFLEKGLENNMPLYTCTSLANYSVYRLIKGEDEADWTLLSNAVNDTIYTDKDWANLDCNLYQYAVQANYTNASSSFRLSAPLNDCFSIEFNIVDEEDSIIEGATITFNGDELSSYLSEPVKPGEYNYSVVKEAYKTYEGKVIVTDSNITEKVTLTKAVGLEQYSLSEVQVYPNPFKDEIFVSNPEMVNKLIVFDITGQKVKEMPLTGNSASLSELTDGVYFIVIENLIGNRATYKLVKQ
ncbi:carboxypeptidase regulatory-like domain-containing protein, partial [Bacteroidales bacterium OttesenSCG-928-I14]|nr:carboxypeptidase regulatory-like domain-containing protein [Bacteroidales bacterium OttesenSCG-928-I14]